MVATPEEVRAEGEADRERREIAELEKLARIVPPRDARESSTEVGRSCPQSGCRPFRRLDLLRMGTWEPSYP
jgi:hypothetical protein